MKISTPLVTINFRLEGINPGVVRINSLLVSGENRFSTDGKEYSSSEN